MKHIYISILVNLLGGFGLLNATNPPPTIEDVDFYEAGSNYYNYPWLTETPPEQTPVPDGYIPYHIEHYGRHGSRWHLGNTNYDIPYKLLKKAHKDGKLTELGDEVYHIVDDIRNEFKGRDGELSDKGALQHFVIGQRMARNFPEVINSIADIDARSTVVIRCILSMQNGLKGIQTVVPDLKVTTDASQADMWYMNYEDAVANNIRKNANEKYLKPFTAKHKNKGDYLSRLFSDPVYANKYIGEQLEAPLFALLVNTQSHLKQPWILDRVFSKEEILENWLTKNATFFLMSGNSKLTSGMMPYKQINLLTNIIESADTALVTPHPSANLRYGHDTVLLPLVCLMEINNFGEEINNLEDLAPRGWHDYLITPMGANLQIIFYRPDKDDFNTDDVIVKVMLNEEEVTLPISRDSGPYYSWKDFRDYYMKKMENHKGDNKS